MATVRTVTVKPDGTGDYTTIANALAGESKDLVSLDRQLDVVVGAGVYTDPITDSGYVQNLTCFLRVVAAPGAEASAVWRSSGVATIDPNSASAGAASFSSAFSRLERVQVANDGSTASSFGVLLTGSSASRVFVRLRGAGGNCYNLSSGAVLKNCIFMGGFYGFDNTASTLYNCSGSGAVNGTRGLGTGPLARNCALYGNGSDWTGNLFNWSSSSSNNAGSNATFPKGSYTALTSSPWTNAPGGDFTLFGGSPLINAGADLSAQGVVVDIAGTARPQGSAYDIGASEYVASGGGTLQSVSLSATSLASAGFSDHLRLPRALASTALASPALSFSLLHRRTLAAASLCLPSLGSSAGGQLAALALGLATFGRSIRATRAVQVQAAPGLVARRRLQKALPATILSAASLIPNRARKTVLAASPAALASLSARVSYGTGPLPSQGSSAQALALYKALISR